jgi:hypothetical protein
MIGVRGWVEGHKYLVYFNDGVEYIQEVATGRTARLFDEAAEIEAFAWPGWTYRDPSRSGTP